MKNSLLIILAAPSGTGKSTICKELIKRNNKWKFSVSVTTRIPREGEIDGKDYKFISLNDKILIQSEDLMKFSLKKVIQSIILLLILINPSI